MRLFHYVVILTQNHRQIFNHRTQGLSATQQANNNGMAVKDCDAFNKGY